MKRIALAILFTCLIQPISSFASDLRVPFSAIGGVRNDYDSPGSTIAVFANLMKSWDGALSKEDRKKHTGAVIFALENMQDGQVVEWYNNSEETFGKIKPIMSWNVQGGVCRKLVTLVQKEGKMREYEEVGCYTLDSQFWTFSRR